MSADEIDALLAAAVPARLATIDRDGFPHVTPLWFIWADGTFYLTSIADRPHPRRLEANPRAGICVDVEEPERDDGQRPNR
ncbi:MAG TPA: pyridoxamine 5'-phosphate oxidase family protein [Solirubrobacteraceae bacterium]|nr:pyridoxamine 5'-phosphate oxidase family protein [Solirubrobacteraceae bacterium]